MQSHTTTLKVIYGLIVEDQVLFTSVQKVINNVTHTVTGMSRALEVVQPVSKSAARGRVALFPVTGRAAQRWRSGPRRTPVNPGLANDVINDPEAGGPWSRWYEADIVRRKWSGGVQAGG